MERSGARKCGQRGPDLRGGGLIEVGSDRYLATTGQSSELSLYRLLTGLTEAYADLNLTSTTLRLVDGIVRVMDQLLDVDLEVDPYVLEHLLDRGELTLRLASEAVRAGTDLDGDFADDRCVGHSSPPSWGMKKPPRACTGRGLGDRCLEGASYSAHSAAMLRRM